MTHYVTFEEAAQILGVSRESVRLYCKRGLLEQGESHGKKKILKKSLDNLMKYDVVAQEKAIESYKREMAATKAEIAQMNKRLLAVKELLRVKLNIYENYCEVCNFLLNFVENTYTAAGISNREKDIAERLLRGTMLTDIAEQYDLTKERVRQIWIKTLKKIAHSRKISNAVQENQLLTIQVSTLEARNSELLRALKDKGWNESLENCVHIPQSLMGLENEYIGIRAYHCLRTLGMEHLYQLTFISKRNLGRLRNLGRKSIDGIEKFLESYGLRFDDPRSLENVQLPLGETVVEIPWSEINDQVIEVKKIWKK